MTDRPRTRRPLPRGIAAPSWCSRSCCCSRRSRSRRWSSTSASRASSSDASGARRRRGGDEGLRGGRAEGAGSVAAVSMSAFHALAPDADVEVVGGEGEWNANASLALTGRFVPQMQANAADAPRRWLRRRHVLRERRTHGTLGLLAGRLRRRRRRSRAARAGCVERSIRSVSMPRIKSRRAVRRCRFLFGRAALMDGADGTYDPGATASPCARRRSPMDDRERRACVLRCTSDPRWRRFRSSSRCDHDRRRRADPRAQLGHHGALGPLDAGAARGRCRRRRRRRPDPAARCGACRAVVHGLAFRRVRLRPRRRPRG